MKTILLLCIFVIFVGANEFDMFDEIDKEESSFEVEKPLIDAELRVNHQINKTRDNETVLFLNLKKESENFFGDMRLVVDDENQTLLVKELYYKNSFYKVNYYKIGRINFKEGVAKGYNPTDYFNQNPSLSLSNDPKEIRDNRLGSLAISSTSFFDEYVVKLLYSPYISVEEGTLWSDKKHIGLYLDKTNNQHRASAYLSYSGIEDLSASMILHHNDNGLNVGLNLSYIYSNFIYYSESSFKEMDGEYITNLATGVTYTSDLNIVTSLEYDYNDDKRENQESFFLSSRASDVYTNLDINVLMWLNTANSDFSTQLGIEYAFSDNIQTNTSIKSDFDNYEILLEVKYFF